MKALFYSNSLINFRVYYGPIDFVIHVSVNFTQSTPLIFVLSPSYLKAVPFGEELL